MISGAMFVRKKTNNSGARSVQVIDKSKGFHVIKTIGCSDNPEEIERLVQQGRSWIHQQDKQIPLFLPDQKERGIVSAFVSQLRNSHIHTMGPELIFGTLFEQIGFGKIPDELFRHIVIARLAYPTSKLKTVDYLKRYRGIEMNVDSIYRFLDKLHSRYKDDVEAIAYETTKRILGPTISIVFYDMTTLYFEAEDEDDLRKIGFSKDGKFQHPQIMLGLLVGKGGYPISYDIFEGNTFEGHTLLPVLQRIEKKYGFKDITVVADAAMLSKTNLSSLGHAHYRFVVGGRIKNESQKLQKKILDQLNLLQEGKPLELMRDDGTRLIVTWTEQRARKDAHNRDKGLTKLKNRIRFGQLTKEHLNNRGYNKFLILEGKVKVTLDEKKIELGAQWDGLKGYLTNTDLPPETIVENYRELWQIEKAFRISKTDLRIRPVYHFRKRRIEAHICIAFAAYTLFKELERRLSQAGIAMSPKRAGELTHNMYSLSYLLPGDASPRETILGMDEQQQVLFDLIHPS